ncbi:MAG TPA: excinuclease ABC subunit UvrC, partial [Vicinamibacterales bacterium]|nr:excinuclease ABC subunit UvrC [Vicinamibacterales bacterium]
MPIRDLKAQIGRLPEQPGVYLYFNGAGDTLYVGKARTLRDRVRSYLGAYGMSPRIDALLDEAERLEVIVTDSVVEALALENHLIKQRSPKYNILLRDDKNYPYLQLTTGEAFPRVLVARRIERDGHVYAGPFLPARFARRTMSLTHRLFGIRSCNEVITGQRGRPCLEYDIKRCLAPCVETLCSPDEYQRAVQDTKLFLEGRREELVEQLRQRMVEAADAEQYERAAQLRDAMRTVQTLHEQQQKMAHAELGDRDVFGVKVGPAGAVIQVFLVRRGRVIERIELVTDPDGGAGGSEADVLQAAIPQFYELRAVPPEVHVPVDIEDADAVAEWLGGRAGRRVILHVPRRGGKRGLVDLATRNATLAYQTRFGHGATANYDALETLRAVLQLPSLPRRIECFDISTIQGAETVASMVVCEDGRMRRGEYRKFRVRAEGTPTRADVRQSFSPAAEAVGQGFSPAREAVAPAAEPAAGAPRFLDDFAAMRQV